MQGCSRIRTYFLSVIVTAALLAATCGPGLAQGGSKVLGTGLAGTAGLVLDARGYAYTADREAGKVLCVPPGGEPMVYARVDSPTALAVDRLRTLFVGTASGDIYMVTPDGAVSRVFRCGNAVSGLSIDRDGNLLAATGKGAILRVTRDEFHFSD
jgi:sugar lactone lactonase YvrE